MMANDQSYSIGLEISGFIRGIGGAGIALNQFMELGAKLAMVGRKLWATIEQGAGLWDMSKRTGQTVQSLFLLGRGFELAGVSASMVPRALFQMDKALGGVNEQGEATSSIFSQMGLDIGKLKQMGGAEAMQTILKAISSMGRADAAFAASKIFGRGGAQDMLQLARSSEDFAEGMEASAEAAKTMGAHAAGFDRLTDTIQLLKWKIQDAFLVPAGFAADWGNAFAKGVKAGNISELMRLSMIVAFEQSVNVLWKLLASVAAAVPSMFAAAFSAAGAVGNVKRGLAAKGASALGEWMSGGPFEGSFIGKAFGRAGAGWAGVEKAEMGAAAESIGSGMDAVMKAIKAAMDANTKDLIVSSNAGKLLALLALANPAAGPGGGAGGTLGFFGGGGKPGSLEVNSLERIGALFGGGAQAADHQRETAQNTRKMVDQNARLLDILTRSNIDPRVFANTA